MLICLLICSEFFKAGNYLASISAYTHGMKLSEKMSSLYANRSAAHYAAGNYRRCAEDCSTVYYIVLSRRIVEYSLKRKEEASRGNFDEPPIFCCRCPRSATTGPEADCTKVRGEQRLEGTLSRSAWRGSLQIVRTSAWHSRVGGCPRSRSAKWHDKARFTGGQRLLPSQRLGK